MTVPRPYEVNLGPTNAIFDFSKLAKIFLVENLFRPGRDRIPARRGSQTGGRGGQGRAKEGQIRAIYTQKLAKIYGQKIFLTGLQHKYDIQYSFMVGHVPMRVCFVLCMSCNWVMATHAVTS